MRKREYIEGNDEAADAALHKSGRHSLHVDEYLLRSIVR